MNSRADEDESKEIKQLLAERKRKGMGTDKAFRHQDTGGRDKGSIELMRRGEEDHESDYSSENDVFY